MRRVPLQVSQEATRVRALCLTVSTPAPSNWAASPVSYDSMGTIRRSGSVDSVVSSIRRVGGLAGFGACDRDAQERLNAEHDRRQHCERAYQTPDRQDFDYTS